jgi:hypothetical protein
VRELKLETTFKINRVILFDSIKELTADRYHELNKLMMLDFGVGSDINSVAEHFSRFHTLLSSGKVDEATQEAKNLHNNFYYIIQGINIRSFCFAAMIKEINGKSVFGFSQQEISERIDKLCQMGLKQTDVQDIVDDVKKNLSRNFEPIFLIDTEMKPQ